MTPKLISALPSRSTKAGMIVWKGRLRGPTRFMRYHDDPAYLRRLMVDEELMHRYAGVYWRAGTMPHPRRGDR